MKNIIFTLLLSLLACSQPSTHKTTSVKSGEALQPGVVHENIKCKKDTSIGYSVYLPKNYNSTTKELPAIFFFDAHKRGVLPVKKYKELADKYGIILAGSNSSLNGQKGEMTNRIVNTTIKDVLGRFRLDKGRIYSAGFSGGARVAVLAAMLGNFGIRGVIGCAAGFPDVHNPANMDFTWVGVVGDRDFNFLELVNLNRNLKTSGYRSHLLVFDGKHEWPPEETFDSALNILFGSTTAEYYDDPALRPLEKKEIGQRQFLAGALASKDLSWWNAEIAKLQKGTKNSGTEAERLMNARLLSFMSMVSFMYANSAIEQRQKEQASKLLIVYQKVDPENPDVYFLKAEYEILNNNPEKALDMLQKAADLGYADREKLMGSRFFSQLHQNARFKSVLKKIEGN